MVAVVFVRFDNGIGIVILVCLCFVSFDMIWGLPSAFSLLIFVSLKWYGGCPFVWVCCFCCWQFWAAWGAHACLSGLKYMEIAYLFGLSFELLVLKWSNLVSNFDLTQILHDLELTCRLEMHSCSSCITVGAPTYISCIMCILPCFSWGGNGFGLVVLKVWGVRNYAGQ